MYEFKHPILFVAFIAIFLFHCIQVTSESNGDQHEFNYNRGSGKGPNHWSKINEEWSVCGKGNMQSPIDLSDEKVEVFKHLGRLKKSYKPSNATLVNSGHDIMVKWDYGAGAIYVNGTKYILKQCHWHTPSEHTINGRSYALEVHMVHETSDKRRAVLAALYKIGQKDNFISEVADHLRAIANSKDEEKEVGVIDPRHVKLGSRKYYRYMGSLTAPPCTEGVIWTIVKKGYEKNARPTQPTNDRIVALYRP
ncbi:hypothetical protein AAC387_Pa01g1217 [Persea americana]